MCSRRNTGRGSLDSGAACAQNLPGTKLLTAKDDFAKVMVEGIDHYLDRRLANSPQLRDERWQVDTSSPAAYEASLKPRRERLAHILGVVDRRLPPELEFVATSERPTLVAETERFKVFNVRWAVLPGLSAEGLLLEPKEKPKANVIVIPDADQPPEMLVGLVEGVPPASQIGRRLADRGARVLIPTLINRQDTYSGEAGSTGGPTRPTASSSTGKRTRWGRHVIGYELQKVFAGIDWSARNKDTRRSPSSATSKEGCSRCMPGRWIRASGRPSSPGISVRGKKSPTSRSIAMFGACSRASATPNWRRSRAAVLLPRTGSGRD